MQDIKEILKDKVFKDIENGNEKMSENTVEFLKNNFYLWFGGEAERIYDMFKVIYSFSNSKTPFTIKVSKGFLFGYRRQFIASNALSYLDYMNYCEVMDSFVEEGEKKLFKAIDNDEEEIFFIYDPSSKAINTSTTLVQLNPEGGDINDK
jgi:hypothetical protein